MLSVSVRSLSATFCLKDSTLESNETLSSNTSPDRGQIFTLIVSPMMLTKKCVSNNDLPFPLTEIKPIEQLKNFNQQVHAILNGEFTAIWCENMIIDSIFCICICYTCTQVFAVILKGLPGRF